MDSAGLNRAFVSSPWKHDGLQPANADLDFCVLIHGEWAAQQQDRAGHKSQVGHKCENVFLDVVDKGTGAVSTGLCSPFVR